MDIRKVIIFNGSPIRTKIRKFIIADTLYNQVGLITDRRREKLADAAIQITTKKGVGLTPNW